MGCASSSTFDGPAAAPPRSRCVTDAPTQQPLAAPAKCRQVASVAELADAHCPIRAFPSMAPSVSTGDEELRLQIEFDREWAFPPCGVPMPEPSAADRAARIRRAAREGIQAGRVTSDVDEVPVPAESDADVRQAKRRVRAWMDELLQIAAAWASPSAANNRPTPLAVSTDDQYLVVHAALQLGGSHRGRE